MLIKCLISLESENSGRLLSGESTWILLKTAEIWLRPDLHYFFYYCCLLLNNKIYFLLTCL